MANPLEPMDVEFGVVVLRNDKMTDLVCTEVTSRGAWGHKTLFFGGRDKNYHNFIYYHPPPVAPLENLALYIVSFEAIPTLTVRQESQRALERIEKPTKRQSSSPQERQAATYVDGSSKVCLLLLRVSESRRL